MCLICIEMDKKTLSPWEALRNLSEMTTQIGPDHSVEVEKKIFDSLLDLDDPDLSKTCEFCEYEPCACGEVDDIW